MKFITIILLIGVFTCGQMASDMAQQQCCFSWQKLNQTCQASAIDQTKVMVKIENQTRVLKDAMKTAHDQLGIEFTFLTMDLQTRLYEQTDLIKELLTEISDLRNETIQSNQETIFKLESQKLMMENKKLLDETNLLHQNNNILNNTLMDVKESRDYFVEETNRLKNQLKNIQNKNKHLNDSLAELKENCETEIQKLQDEVQILQNVTQSMNESLQGSSKQASSGNRPSGSGQWISGGHRSNGTFNMIIIKVKGTHQINHMYHLSALTYRMSVIANQLWVSVRGNHTIQVLNPYSVNRTKQITLTNNIQYPWSLRSDNNGLVLLCSETGLDVISETGTQLYKVGNGHISDIHVGRNVAYMYNSSNNNVVTIIYNKGMWVINNTFLASKTERDGRNTLLVIGQTLYVCSNFKHVIHTYTLSGRYITQLGGPGRNTPGGLYNPYLCGVDSQDSVLVCDNSNNRVQVLSADGTWRAFTLPGITTPLDLITDGGRNIWVLYQDNHFFHRITRFSA